MHVITIAGPKGGGGKSLLTTNLAVCASADGPTVMVDLDAQGTLTEFWTLRKDRRNLFLYEEEGTLDAVIIDMGRQWQYCIIDGPPHDQDVIEMSVLVASAVLIPVKLAHADTSAIDSILGMCAKHAKPWAFVVNEYDGRKQFQNANNIALTELLDAHGEEHMLQQRISYDPRYRVGQIRGLTGMDLSKPLADEISTLWDQVKGLAGIERRKGGRRRG